METNADDGRRNDTWSSTIVYGAKCFYEFYLLDDILFSFVNDRFVDRSRFRTDSSSRIREISMGIFS